MLGFLNVDLNGLLNFPQITKKMENCFFSFNIILGCTKSLVQSTLLSLVIEVLVVGQGGNEEGLSKQNLGNIVKIS